MNAAIDLCWRVERACQQAWPAARTVEMGGWLARLSGGPTRRTSSVNPTRNAGDPASVLPALAELYAQADQPLIFRIPAIARGLDAHLDALGFGPPEAETATLLAPLHQSSSLDVEIENAASAAWQDARTRIVGADPAARAAFAEMLGLLAPPVAFAAIRQSGEITSIAYGALREGLLVIESVATDPACRGNGLARRTVAALMAWGQQAGAEAACLQVVADNAPAIALYRRLGFDRELYRYHYRRPAGA